MRVKDVSSSLRLSTTDVSANGGYFIQHVAPYCLGIVSFRLVTDEDNYVHGDNGGRYRRRGTDTSVKKFHEYQEVRS